MGAVQPPLMTLPASAYVTPQRGHAARPGTGPKGETCGGCAHRVLWQSDSGKKFSKCGLCRGNWTRGRGSDITKKDAACVAWQPKPAAERA